MAFLNESQADRGVRVLGAVVLLSAGAGLRHPLLRFAGS